MVLDDFPYEGEYLKITKMRKPAPLFLRFGHFMSECNEPSLNWATGEYEKGISVYPAHLNDDGIVEVDAGWYGDIWNGWDTDSDNSYKHRAQYVLTGKVIAEGSDGEPVLQVSSIVVRGVRHPKAIAGIQIQEFDF